MNSILPQISPETTAACEAHQRACLQDIFRDMMPPDEIDALLDVPTQLTERETLTVEALIQTILDVRSILYNLNRYGSKHDRCDAESIAEAFGKADAAYRIGRKLLDGGR